MKRFLLTLFLSTFLAGGLSAGIAKKQAAKQTRAESRAVSLPSTMIKCLAASYDVIDEEVAEFYMLFTDKIKSSWSKEDGPVLENGFVLRLDIYGPKSSPVVLPSGDYKASSEYTSMTYDPDFSYVEYYDANGQPDSDVYPIVGDIKVVNSDNGTYTLKANVQNGATVTEMSFSGVVEFDDGTLPPSTYNQIRMNLDLKLTAGAMANYDGNLFESNTGAMYINLYDHSFDPETGGMTEDGFSLALQVFGKLFSDPKNATLEPGTYTVARNFNRYTWFPGMEMDYMGTTVIMGCYVKERNPSKYHDGYGYSYLSDGTIVIEDKGSGVFAITVDAVTTLGHVVKGSFEGEVPVHDKSNDDGHPGLSTLEDDVELDLAQIPVCRTFSNGVTNGCQRFIVDIGSPAGRDNVTEGDIMRLEFLLPQGTKYVQNGTYTVVDEKWDTAMEPYKMTKGYFTATDLSGTRYMHFEEGRTLIMDHYAPAESGSVGVMKNADDTYTFNISIIDDMQFRINGNWTGPMILMYDPDQLSAISDVVSDGESISVEWIDSSTLLVSGIGSANGAKVFGVSGVQMNCGINGNMIDMSGLSSGIYVLNINGKSIKVLKK